MARKRYPGDRFKFNTRQRLTSDDLQEAIELNDLATRRSLAHLVRWGNDRAGFVSSGLNVSQDSPAAMTVRVGIGWGMIWSHTEADGISVSPVVFDENIHGYHEFCTYGAVQEPVIAANASGNPRIDMIVARLFIADAEEQNVDIFNTTTRVFDSTPSTPTRIRKNLTVANGGILVIQGTPGASPSEPSIEVNDVPLAAVYVANGATTITDAVIFDRRPRMTPASVSGWFANTGAYTTHAFYGDSKTCKDIHNGIISEPVDIVFYDKPGTGRYRYTLSGFLTTSSGVPLVNVVCGLEGTGGGQWSYSLAASDPHLEIRTFDNSGAAADKAFQMTVTERDWNIS